MTDSTDDVDQGYDGSDIPEAPKPIKKPKIGKKPINYDDTIKDISYSFKISLPLDNQKFAAWYTIEYGETRSFKPGVEKDKQRAKLQDDVELEVVNCVDILRQKIQKGEVCQTVL